MSCSGRPQCPREGICEREKSTESRFLRRSSSQQQHSLSLFLVGFASLSLAGLLAFLLLTLTLELCFTVATESYEYVPWGSPVLFREGIGGKKL